MKRLWTRILVVLTTLVLLDQAILYVGLKDGRLFGHWTAPFDPPLFTEWQHERRAEIEALVAAGESSGGASLFDADLGWCPPPGLKRGRYEHDWSGSRLSHRPLARKKLAGVRRIVAVGGSFTAGDEVGGAETWLAQLEEERPDLEVANLGIPGFGPDQALLRFQRDGRSLEADEVWLGYMPGATLRITTQYPPTFRHWATILAFKPRFTLNTDGSLRLIPSPAKTLRDVLLLLTHQSEFVAAMAEDDWIKRTPAAFAPRGSSWTHWLATGRLGVTWLESGGRDVGTMIRDSENEVRRLLTAIILALDADARAAGARFRLIILPSRSDLAMAANQGGPYWESLTTELTAQGISCIDATDALLAAGGANHDPLWMPQGHYSPQANGVVAGAVIRSVDAGSQ